MRNIKIVVEYDGTGYHGWQRQDDHVTVQQVLEEKISLITSEEIKVFGSSRTDAGVHAINQVAHFKTESGICLSNLLRGINSLLPDDIVVKDLKEADESFHARYNVKSKVYLYQIFNKHVRPVVYRKYSWFIFDLLDIDRMRETDSFLRGTHDFSSFCASGTDIIDRTRTVINFDIMSNNNGIIQIFIEADGFLKYMVRNIVGTLVDVGRGKRLPAEFQDIIKAKDRNRAGMTAPPQGLFLKEVKY